MQLKSTPLGEAVNTPSFRSFRVTQYRDGSFSVDVDYVLQTKIGDAVLAEEPLTSRTLTDSEVRNHPQFPAIYPLIQAFSRAEFAAARPDLVETPE